MKNQSLHAHLLAVFVAFGLAAPQAFAEKPEWAGKGKGGEWHEKGKGKGHGHAKGQGRDKGHRDDDDRGRRSQHFSDDHRVAVHEYYDQAFRSGRCPPGLAKKNNGCMPPGQAKKWRMGRPLPREVVYYQVPQDLAVRLGAPPAGHRYVRVGNDILLLTTNQAIVVDALQNFGR